MTDLKIPLFDVDFDDREIAAVEDVIRSGWLTMGRRVRDFEQEFAQMLGIKHAIAVSSCTAALHLAHLALDIGPGDEVIVPSLTFVATVNSIRYTGAIPVFADITSLDNWNIGLESIQEIKTSKCKAITVVHYAGYPCAMDDICQYARENDLFVIEDCAHAPGTFFKGKALGAWGNIGCFSFFSNKNMSTGEGGMVTTNDDRIAEKIRLMRSHGMTTVTLDRHKGHAFSYDVVQTGYNYRPTELMAALGVVQMEKLNLKNERRRELVQYYRNTLKHVVPDVHIPFQQFPLDQSSGHIMPVMLPHSISRSGVMDSLRRKGIQTSIHYTPVHTFSIYAKSLKISQLSLTNKVGVQCLTLPLFPTLSMDQIDMCVTALAVECNQK